MGGKTFLLNFIVALAFKCVQSQFRAGYISWELVQGKSNTVRFTVKTSWLRSAGTYVQIVNGTAKRQEGYQPVKGDLIKFAGFHTPKFLTTDFVGKNMEEYLQATVTSNTESLPNGAADRGAGKPHAVSDWAYYGNNWFEAISVFEFTYPRSDITYPAELQGCCRQQPMRKDSTGAIQFRDGVGLLSLASTPFTIRSMVRLDRDPPPISFIPTFFPFSVESGATTTLDLPILDYASSYHPNNRNIPSDPANTWADDIISMGREAQGDLAQTASRPATGRRLLQIPPTGPDATSLADLPTPKLVLVTAADTGNDISMLPWDAPGAPAPGLVTLYHQPGCGAGAPAAGRPVQSVRLAAGMDTCLGGPAAAYPDGGTVARNFSSVLVPAGLLISLSDACEYSDPPSTAAVDALPSLGGFLAGYGPFRSGNALPNAAEGPATFPNSTSSVPVCWNLPPAYRGSTVRAMPSGDTSVPMSVRYRRVPDGRNQTSLFLFNFFDQQLQGNFPVKLRMATGTSSEAAVEFVLHVITTAQVGPGVAGRQLVEGAGFPATAADGTLASDSGLGTLRGVPLPTGFPSSVSWVFQPSSFQAQGPIVFDNLGLRAFGPAGPSSGSLGSGWSMSWTPCPAATGAYWYCLGAQELQAPHDFASSKCAYMEVLPDLPPTLHFLDDAGVDSDTYRLHMGQTLRVTVRATETRPDAVAAFGISQVNVNTGDRLRAKVMYKYAPAAGGVAPSLLEPALPRFLGLTVAAARASAGPPGAVPPSRAALDRLLTYVPARVHSGLEVEVCFVAVDLQGACRRTGLAAQRCLLTRTVRCRYSLKAGESLVTVAGLFETNWVQLFALNPTYSTPEVPATNNSAVINIGHLYRVQGGDTGRGQSAEELRVLLGCNVARLMQLNADLTRQTAATWSPLLPVGRELCVLPDSCGSDA